MLNLRGYRTRAKGLIDYLPYAAMIAPGVILTKEGALMGAWEYFGQDTASVTPEDQAQISWMFSQMLRELDTGWMLQADAIRRPTSSYPKAGLSHFPDSVTQGIEDERRNFFEQGKVFQTSTIFTLTFKPPSDMVKNGSFTKALEYFNEITDKIESTFPAIPGFVGNRLTEYEETDEKGRTHKYSLLLTHIQHCISGRLQPVLLPEPAMFLDAFMGNEDFVGGLKPRIGEKRIMVVAIDGLPAASRPDMLSILDKLPVDYRFSSRFIFLDRFDAKKKIKDEQKGWEQQTMSFLDKYFERPNPKINQDAVNMVQDAEDALTELESGEARFGYLTSVVILLGEDEKELRKNALDLGAEIEARGFTPRIETWNAMEAWFGSLPGNSRPNVRRPLITTNNLPHLLPLASVWPGSETCPCPFYPPGSPPLLICTTDGSTPFRLNLHSGDLGHTLIFGPTGAGKSTLLALIAAQFRRYPEATIFSFDKGMSLFGLCLGAGGDHYDVGGEDAVLSFAPLQRIDESDEEMTWAAGWVADLLTLQKVEVLPRHKAVIHDALMALRESPAEQRSLTDLCLRIMDNELKVALEHYTGDRPMGRLLDSNADNLSLSKFTVFEIETLMEMGNENMIPVLTYLFRRIRKALHGQPAMVILDEAWIMFGHPVFRDQIKEWLKTMRKANCAIVMATQSLFDAADANILHVLEDSCPTKIFLPNFQANSPQQLPLYTGLNLNSTQIGIIRGGQPKRDYYVVSREGKREVQLALTRPQLAFLGSSSKDNIARMKELHSEYGDDWTKHWLAERTAR
jgi:type IV secretion system protein VirB4